jgi:cell division septation protein DedD
MRHIRPLIFTTVFTLAAWPALVQAQRGQFTVQIESVQSQAVAESVVQQLKARGLEAYWVKSNIAGIGLRYRVRVGQFPTRTAAKLHGARLQQRGVITDFFVAEYELPAPAAEVKQRPGAPAEAVAKPAQPLPPSAATPRPQRAEPTDTASPKPTPAPKPRLTSPPSNPLPFDRLRRPRDAVAVVPTSSSHERLAPRASPGGEGKATEEDARQAETSAAAATAAAATAVTEFLRYRDVAYGYSFDYPRHWDGGKLSDDELQAQRIDAGVIFRSKRDAAFMNAVWNRLKGANSQSYDNNQIVDLVVKSLGSGAGFQGLTETARRVVSEGDQVNTFVDLKTVLSQTNAPAPLEFLGKAVIIRSPEGILLVVTFYSKNSPPEIAESAARIVSSARAPQ